MWTTLLPDPIRQRWQHRSFEVRLDERRMDVVLPANSPRVAQSFGGMVDGAEHVAIRVAFCRRDSHLAQ